MIFFALLKLALVGGALCTPPSRVVHTTQGEVRGYLVDHPRGRYYAYRGISYARAKHRFKAPKPAKTWDGTFEATYQVKCPQPDGSGAEDCLVANVFSPEHADARPVLVLLHDGDFQSGWGAFKPPIQLIAHNFVIVTFNYRLSAFGFLCLKTAQAPGNAGLKDQVAALYWIQRNIANFGGNPLDVTVYGIGSGAASIQLILLSGAAKGLLHKAILESGSALSPLSLSYDPVSTAFYAAVVMGYIGDNNAEDLSKFYENQSGKKLVNASTLFLPCVENNLESTHSLLELDPMEIFKRQTYQAVPMIIAYTDMLGANTNTEIESDELPNNLENLLPNNLEFDNDNMKQRVATFVKEIYLGSEQLEQKSVRSYLDYFEDVTFEYPIVKSAVLHAATSATPTYLMKLVAKDEPNKCCKNIFDYFYDKDMDNTDQMIAERLLTLWSNFIKIGDPTPLTTSLVPVLWQPVQASLDDVHMTSVAGLVIGNTVRMSQSLVNDKMVFWDQLYRKFYRFHRLTEENIEIT